jgi:hypothetical protein
VAPEDEQPATVPLTLYFDDPLQSFVMAAIETARHLEREGDPSRATCWGWLRREAAKLGAVEFSPGTGVLRVERALAATNESL